MPQAPRHHSTLTSRAAAPPLIRVFSKSHPPWSKADQIAQSDESKETPAVISPTPGTDPFEEPEHEADSSQIELNGEQIDLRRCSWCDELTPSLKAFNLPKVFLIPIIVHYQVFETEPNEACPGCTRWILLKYLACQIITANILWPVLVLPVYIFCSAAVSVGSVYRGRG